MANKLLDSKIFNSRITTPNVSAKEKWIGFLLGPTGALLVNAILGGGFLNIFYTDVIGIGNLWRGMFLAVFPVIAKILDAITNFIMGWIIEHTHTKQGKARPYILLAAFLLPISGILLYTVPNADQKIQAVWIMITYNLFFSIAYTVYNMSHSLMVPLSTRNTTQRGSVAVFNQVAAIMVTGIIAALLVPMLLLPMLGTSKSLWITAMSIVSILSLPLVLLEYYYTKERVTEELGEQEEKKVPYSKTIKAVFTDPLTVLILIYFFLSTFASTIKVNSTIYYCNYVLGTYADGITQTLLNVIGGIPMGIGIFAVWPLAKKIGKRNIVVLGCLITSLGSAICCMFPTNMPGMLAGQFVKNIGSLPAAYVFMALFADVLDHLEWKNGFRCDGMAMSVYSTIGVVLGGVSLGLLNLVISSTGYIKPYTATADTLSAVVAQITNAGQTMQLSVDALKPTLDGIYTIAVNQNAATTGALIFMFVGLDVIAGILCAVLLMLINVEKTIGLKQKVIRERMGKTEEAPDEDAVKAAEKLQKKLSAMSPEKRAAFETKQKAKEAKLLAFWEKESKANEVYYAKMQASLRE
ncbi:MAG: MFS transporter [Faecousia sp.]